MNLLQRFRPPDVKWLWFTNIKELPVKVQTKIVLTLISTKKILKCIKDLNYSVAFKKGRKMSTKVSETISHDSL